MTASTGVHSEPAGQERVSVTVTGVVQGVGFRPFVHRIATELGLTGFVGNDALAVFVEAQGPPKVLAEFTRRLLMEPPPMSMITSVSSRHISPTTEVSFVIVASESRAGPRTLIPPDVATCDNCLAELFDHSDRRYRHPFITCTDCGPRLTIIRDVPYDRPTTTMEQFEMCATCAREYADPSDRRYHAQTVACPACGPALRFEYEGACVAVGDGAIDAAQRALVAGQIVAIKGIGGFHLACRADDPSAIRRLRERKARDEKPFALLVRNVDVARRIVKIDDTEVSVLVGQARPIVLMHRRGDAPVDDSVAPGNPLIGILLPYSPIHHLLLAPVPGSDVTPPEVLVMTSANVNNEPLCFDDADASSRLPYLADAVLTHNRPIFLPCDDSVVRVVDGHALPIRRSRGYAPLPVALGQALPSTLAVGGELKNTFCLVDGSNAFCSAHIGDMGSLDTNRAFERAVGQMTTVHRIEPQVIAADAHPAYQTRVWAERHSGGPGEPTLTFVQHHHAHVVSLLAEHGRIGEPIIGVAFDGTGYGDDAAVWGGEILLLRERSEHYERAGHLLEVGMQGGDGAVRNPCRMALSYLDASDVAWSADLPPVAACEPAELRTLRMQITSRTRSVQCTSMGRLFDAVAALLGVRQRIGYEGQAAIELEILAARTGRCGVPLHFDVDEGGVIDYRPMIRGLAAAVLADTAPGELAYGFHVAVADAVGLTASAIARRSNVGTVGLTGGVFQNVLLTALCRTQLEGCDLEVLTHRVVPPNDGGLALGQAVVAALSAAAERLDG